MFLAAAFLATGFLATVFLAAAVFLGDAVFFEPAEPGRPPVGFAVDLVAFLAVVFRGVF